MTTTIIWENKNNKEYSIEYFSLKSQIDMNIMKGTAIAMLGYKPTLIIYEIITDTNWRTRSVKIKQQTSDGEIRYIYLDIDQDQNWRKSINERPSDFSAVLDLASASGLNDIDLQITPSTNTLPINRLNLEVGEMQEIDVLWISFPELNLIRQQQKYSKINEGFYIFEIPKTGFVAKLEVDKLGLVVNYENLYRRLS